jgi:Mg-chelatase subunit ChlD
MHESMVLLALSILIWFQKILEALKELSPSGGTNLQGGIDLALELFQSSIAKGATTSCQSIMLVVSDAVVSQNLFTINNE